MRKKDTKSETAKAKAYLKKIPQRLEALLNTQVRKDRFNEAWKYINKDMDKWTEWEMMHDQYSFKDQEEAEKIKKELMPRYIRWARQYYNIFPIEEPVTETNPLDDREKILSAYFGITWIADIITEKYPNSPDTLNYHSGYDNEVDTFGPFRVKTGFSDRIKKKFDNAFTTIQEDLEQKEKDESHPKENGGEEKTNFTYLNIAKESIAELIKRGEGHHIEFKSTLEYDIKTVQRNKDLNKECLKTIAAFLNTDGGVLIIGVKDDGTILGIEEDIKDVQRKNTDGFELKLRDLIQNFLKPFPYNKIQISFEKISQSLICRVNVEPLNRSQIVYLEDCIYVRDGNRKINLKGTVEIANWIQQRSNVI